MHIFFVLFFTNSYTLSRPVTVGINFLYKIVYIIRATYCRYFPYKILYIIRATYCR